MAGVVVAVPRRTLFDGTLQLRVGRQLAQHAGAAQSPEVLARAAWHARLLQLLEILTRPSRYLGALQALAQQRAAAARCRTHEVAARWLDRRLLGGRLGRRVGAGTPIGHSRHGPGRV